jgi:hypothetical protein
VKFNPCFLSPNRNSGIFKIIRKIDRLRKSGVNLSNNIDVPEIPLSYNFTGIRKNVMPKALIMPAIVSIKKFLICNLFIGKTSLWCENVRKHYVECIFLLSILYHKIGIKVKTKCGKYVGD